jgi:hypothetical protein
VDAIDQDGREPDAWESMHLSYTTQALAEGRYYGALTFAELALMNPGARRSPQELPAKPFTTVRGDRSGQVAAGAGPMSAAAVLPCTAIVTCW